MVVGDKSYQLQLSRIAYSFQGGADMEYLQSAGVRRVSEINRHLKTIAEEIKNHGQ